MRIVVWVSLCGSLCIAGGAQPSAEAAEEMLIWIREKESFVPSRCRLATREDVRQDKLNRIGDVILVGKRGAANAASDLNMGAYVRMRMTESANDTIGSRLERMALSLGQVPNQSCEIWNRLITKRKS